MVKEKIESERNNIKCMLNLELKIDKRFLEVKLSN